LLDGLVDSSAVRGSPEPCVGRARELPDRSIRTPLLLAAQGLKGCAVGKEIAEATAL